MLAVDIDAGNTFLFFGVSPARGSSLLFFEQLTRTTTLFPPGSTIVIGTTDSVDLPSSSLHGVTQSKDSLLLLCLLLQGVDLLGLLEQHCRAALMLLISISRGPLPI